MKEEDKNDPLSPLYIGPEKLLSLYSENNWGNFCLSYLLTNRDYSGVLGLAWEGKAGESEPLLLWYTRTNVEAWLQLGQEFELLVLLVWLCFVWQQHQQKDILPPPAYTTSCSCCLLEGHFGIISW